MFILPLVDSILKRGEDGRAVKNGMSSFTNFESFFFAWCGDGRGRGLGVRVGFRLCCHVHARVYIFRAHAEVRVLWLQRILVSDVALCCVRNRQELCVQLSPD